MSRADRGEREAEVHREHRFALHAAGLARRAARVLARFERARELAARLADDGERLPRVDGGGGDPARLRDLEQVGRLSLGRLEISAECVARGERCRRARFFVR